MATSEIIREMEQLIDTLNEATIKYNDGDPIMSDREWDNLYFKLSELESTSNLVLPISPTRQIHDFSASELKKVKHNHPMLSLAKTKDIKELESFIGNELVAVMCKMDGLTCSLTYQDGYLVRAETRGNGEVGEDVTENIYTISNIPKLLKEKWSGSIDGEVVSSYENFVAQAEKGQYKNPRNFAAGSLRLLDPKETAKRGLAFVAWDVIDDSFETFLEKMYFLQEQDFSCVPCVYNNSDLTIEELIDTVVNEVEYPIDGVVVKYDDVEYYNNKGRTEHHFKGGLAYKFYDELYSTKLTGIKWSLGRTGVVTPVAQFETVEIDGTGVNQASLHNYSIMKEMLGEHPYVNQEIEIFKANQIIPQIASANKDYTSEKTEIKVPLVCPVCGQPLEIHTNEGSEVENIVCINKKCEGKLINKIDHFCGIKGLEIKGLSVKTLEKLINWGYIEKLEDIFTLSQYRQDWCNQIGFGEKSVDKILNNIQLAQKNCELWRFISALGIPLVGTTYAKMLAKIYPTWEDFYSQVDKGFLHLNSIGYEVNKQLTDTSNYQVALNIIQNFNIVNSLYVDDTVTVTETQLTGKTIVITGKLKAYKRNELKDIIEANGGKVTGSVSKNTDMLINNDTESTTAKNKKAKELGIPIINEEDFIKKYL